MRRVRGIAHSPETGETCSVHQAGDATNGANRGIRDGPSHSGSRVRRECIG